MREFEIVKPAIIRILMVDSSSRFGWPKKLTPLTLDAWMRVYGTIAAPGMFQDEDVARLMVYKRITQVEKWHSIEFGFIDPD